MSAEGIDVTVRDGCDKIIGGGLSIIECSVMSPA